MKISVITPLKNGEKYLSETMESVLSQRGEFEIEYFVIDGGSTDKSIQIAETFRRDIETGKRTISCKMIRLTILCNSDNSMFAALADGLNLVTGDIVCYMNADDFYLPNAFSCITGIFSNHPYVKWLTGFPVRYNEPGEMTRFYVPYEYTNNLIMTGFYGRQLPFIQQESVFWRKEINSFIDLGRLKDFKLAGDFFLWHSFAKQGIQLFIVETLLGGNRLRSGQLSENRKAYFNEFDSICDKPSPNNHLMCFFHQVIEKIAGQSLKRRLSDHRLSFKDDAWKIR